MIWSPPKPGAIVDAGCPLSDHPLNDGKVFQWLGLPLPGWTGGVTVRDIVRGKRSPHDGTRVGGVTWVGGQQPGFRALKFLGGSGNYVEAAMPSPAAPISVGVTALTNTLAAQRLINKWDGAKSGWIIDIPASTWRFVIGNGSTVATASIAATAGVWVRLFGTFDGTRLTLYVNGKSAVSSTISGPVGTNTNPVRIGADEVGGQVVNGFVADATILSRAYSPAEVAADYQDAKRGYPDTLRWLSGAFWSIPASGGLLLRRRRMMVAA